MSERLFVGLDMGQVHEFTALAILECDKPSPTLSLRHLQRWQPGQSYADIVGDVVRVLHSLPAVKAIAVDLTAVGKPILDLFYRQPLPCQVHAITLTAGHEVSAAAHGMLVPKRELVTILQMLLQEHRLHIARDLPEAALLAREFASFRARSPLASAEPSLEWRERPHDDLVLAVGLAAWLSVNSIEPYTGPLCYTSGAPWPGDSATEAERTEGPIQRILNELGIDLEAD